MTTAQDRYQQLLEKIDPAFRKARLEKELYGSGDSPFPGAAGMAISSCEAAERDARELAESEKALPPLPARLTGEEMMKLSPQERQEHVMAEQAHQRIAAEREALQRAQKLAAHWMKEAESLLKRLDEFDTSKAGLPKEETEEVPATNGAKPSRQVRRAQARSKK